MALSRDCSAWRMGIERGSVWGERGKKKAERGKRNEEERKRGGIDAKKRKERGWVTQRKGVKKNTKKKKGERKVAQR